MKHLTIIFLFLLASCGEDIEPIPEVSNMELLTAHDWYQGTSNTNIYQSQTITFDGYREIYTSVYVPLGGPDLIITGSWQFTNKEQTNILLTNLIDNTPLLWHFDDETLKILELTESLLIFENNGIEYKLFKNK